MNDGAKESEGMNIKVTKWLLPKDRLTKINFDAALDVANQKLSLGLIARNYKGEILFSSCTGKTFIGQPILIECYALWRAIELYRDLDVKEVILEGDAKIAIWAIKDSMHEWAWMGQLMEDIKYNFSLRADWQSQFTFV